MEGKHLKILYDTGANINIITTNGLNKLLDAEINESQEEQSITIANGTSVSTKLFTNLKININNSCTLIEKFYIINQTNPYFDIILEGEFKRNTDFLLTQMTIAFIKRQKKSPKRLPR